MDNTGRPRSQSIPVKVPREYMKRIKLRNKLKNSCVLCKLRGVEHPLNDCPNFLKMHPKERMQFVRRLNYCPKCLSTKHVLISCDSETACDLCPHDHHTSLHSYEGAVQSFIQLQSKKDQTSKIVLLGTARCYVGDERNPYVYKREPLLSPRAPGVRKRKREVCIMPNNRGNNTRVTIRAMFDSGSQQDFISAESCKRLGLRVYADTNTKRVCGISATYTRIRGITTITIQSRFDSSAVLVLNPFVVDLIAESHPHGMVDTSNFGYLRDIRLADPRYFMPAPIDMLLGSDSFARHLLHDRIKRGDSEPVAVETTFGFIIMGAASIAEEKQEEEEEDEEIEEDNAMLVTRKKPSTEKEGEATEKQDESMPSTSKKSTNTSTEKKEVEATEKQDESISSTSKKSQEERKAPDAEKAIDSDKRVTDEESEETLLKDKDNKAESVQQGIIPDKIESDEAAKVKSE